MDFIYDPVFRATGDPVWDRRTEADLPSRRRLTALRCELAARQRLAAASRGSWPRRLICRLGDGMVSAGERLRAGAGPQSSIRITPSPKTTSPS